MTMWNTGAVIGRTGEEEVDDAQDANGDDKWMSLLGRTTVAMYRCKLKRSTIL